MILKCKLCKQKCHQTKSFGHSPSRQIWRPCSAHAPCLPPPRSPWLPPAQLPACLAAAPFRLSRRRAAPGVPRSQGGSRAGNPGPGRGGLGQWRRAFLRKPRSPDPATWARAASCCCCLPPAPRTPHRHPTRNVSGHQTRSSLSSDSLSRGLQGAERDWILGRV